MTADEDQLRDLFEVLADRQPPTGTDGVWLRERWRRHRARQAGAALAVVALLAGGGALAAMRPDSRAAPSLVASPPSSPLPQPTAAETAPSPDQVTPSPSPTYPIPDTLHEPTGTRLLLSVGGSLQLLDVDTREVTALPLDAGVRDRERINVTRVGNQLVMVGDDSTGAGGGGGVVLATTAGPGSAVRAIGHSDPILRPSVHPGRIWLSSIEESAGPPTTTLTEVDLTGRVHQKVVLPETFGADPYDGGFLRETDGNAELVDPRGHVLRSWNGLRVARVWPDKAVLSEGYGCHSPCRLVLLTAGAADRELRVDGPVAEATFDIALSPDGKRLYSGAQVAEDVPALALTRTNLRTASSTRIPGALSARYYGFGPTFSDDGRWMFFVDADTRHLDVYDVQREQVFRVLDEFRPTISSVVTVD